MTIWEKDGYTISTKKQLLDLQLIHQFLSEESYWAKGISFQDVKKAIEHSSICFGVYKGTLEEGSLQQIGFARSVTDFVRFGYIMDVYIEKTLRGKGLSKWLMEVLTTESDLKDVNKLMLVTYDAQGLYSQFGFEVINDPEHHMKLTRRQ